MKDFWLIWSIEHGGWWMPKESGYTPDVEEAGLYSYKRACQIVEGANKYRQPHEPPNEAMVKAEA